LNRVSDQSDVLPCAELNPFHNDLPQFSVFLMILTNRAFALSIHALQ